MYILPWSSHGVKDQVFRSLFAKLGTDHVLAVHISIRVSGSDNIATIMVVIAVDGSPQRNEILSIFVPNAGHQVRLDFNATLLAGIALALFPQDGIDPVSQSRFSPSTVLAGWLVRHTLSPKTTR
jgi:hypothetical protein